MSKGGHGFDHIAAEIGRDLWARFTRWLGAAGALVVSLLAIAFIALPYHLWRSACDWWRGAPAMRRARTVVGICLLVLLAVAALWFAWMVTAAHRG